MKKFGTFKLMLFSIAWIAGVIILSGHDLQKLQHLSDFNNTELHDLIQAGLLPVFYAWMFFITVKVLFPGQKV